MTILTGKPCKKCGALERNSANNCIPCQKLIEKNWRKRNPDKYSNAMGRWQKKNRDKVNSTVKLRKHANPYITELVKKQIASCKSFKSLFLSYSDIPIELIEIKRLQMQLHHAIKERERFLLEA